MAKSVAVKIEVRWRETGTEQWSAIQSCSPAAQVVVEGLDRTKTYEFEWRGVSACGARSAWGSTAHTLPDVAAGNITLADLKAETDNAAADALAANAELANIASDNVLSQGEKPVVIRDYSVITTEQGGIDAQATAYSITTQKTAYDNAVTALTGYLGTLTSPTAWNNLGGDTTIVGTTFRSKFADVYTSRQALLNAIYAAAKVLSGNAQSTANSAALAAAAAQVDATTALSELDDIAADGKLTADEKVRAKRDYLAVTGEQAGIDGQATAFGITTEKTAYDNAVTALKSYLRTPVGVLDASYNWTGITGTNAITRSTWDSTWTAVYTARQALLNKIAAVAKAAADGAQGAADVANASASVINGSFIKDTSGWTFQGSGTFYQETGGNSPNPAISTYLVHQGGAGITPGAINDARVPVKEGQVVSVIAAFKSVSANAGSYAVSYIRWYDSSGSYLTLSAPGSPSCGPGGTYLQCNSEAKDVAPAGAAYASAELAYYNHTSGYLTATSVRINTHLASQDDLPNGATYGRVVVGKLNAGRPVFDLADTFHFNKNLGYIGDGGGRYGVHQVDGNGLAIVDFSQAGHVNKTADYIAETTVRKWAGESGADVTSNATLLLLDNAGFETDNGWGSNSAGTGSLPSGMSYTSGDSATGARYLQMTAAGATWNARVFSSRAGQKVRVYWSQQRAGSSPNAGATMGVGIRWIDAAGALVANTYSGSYPSSFNWERVYVTYTCPSGAVAGRPYVTSQSQTSGGFGIDDIVIGTPSELEEAGSGIVLGNQLNAPNSLTLNYGSVRSSTALTATSAGAVSVNAFDYYMGAASVHYNAVSNAVTGLTQSTTYFIYCHDAGGKGGTVTWMATTNVNSLLQTYDDIVVAGQVTIPSTGSSGGGGGGLCVCDDMLVAEGLRAGDAVPGDLFDCLDLPTTGMDRFRRALESVDRSTVECVRLHTSLGGVLECSCGTPFDLPGGGVEWAPRMRGHEVVTDRGIETVTRVEHIGMRPVSHIHLGGCSFAAGRDARHRIYSHNLQYKP